MTRRTNWLTTCLTSASFRVVDIYIMQDAKRNSLITVTFFEQKKIPEKIGLTYHGNLNLVWWQVVVLVLIILSIVEKVQLLRVQAAQPADLFLRCKWLTRLAVELCRVVADAVLSMLRSIISIQTLCSFLMLRTGMKCLWERQAKHTLTLSRMTLTSLVLLTWQTLV